MRHLPDMDQGAGTMSEAADQGESPLWVTDAELIRRSGVPEKIARATIRLLDRNPASGFPKKQALWGNRRYWPAVKAYFERYSAGNMTAPLQRRAS